VSVKRLTWDADETWRRWSDWLMVKSLRKKSLQIISVNWKLTV